MLLPRIVPFIFKARNPYLFKGGNVTLNNIGSNFLSHQNNFGTNCSINSETNEKKPQKKTVKIPKITLLHPDNSVTVTLLEEAEKLANKKKLELVKVVEHDPKNNRSIYKLVNSMEFTDIENTDVAHTEHDKNKQKMKSTKLFTLKNKINEHDLAIKIKNINKVLKRGHKVKIFLSHATGGQEPLVQSIKEKVKGTVIEKLKKDSTLLTYSPLLECDHDTPDEHKS